MKKTPSKYFSVSVSLAVSSNYPQTVIKVFNKTKMEEIVETVGSKGPQRHGEAVWQPFVTSLCPAVFSSEERKDGCSHC